MLFGGASSPGTVRMVDQQAIALMQEARAKEAKNDLSGAIKKYRRVVEKHPLSREAPQARFRMAELYEARKEPADAFDQYQKLIDRHPDSPCTGRPWPGRRKWPSALRAAR